MRSYVEARHILRLIRLRGYTKRNGSLLQKIEKYINLVFYDYFDKVCAVALGYKRLTQIQQYRRFNYTRTKRIKSVFGSIDRQFTRPQ